MNWRKQVPRLVSLAFAVAIAGDIALTLSHLRALGLQGRDRSGELRNLPDPTRAAPKRAGARQIVVAHLFGEAPRAREASAAASKTQWVLIGVITTGDPHAGFAIIGPSATAARLVLCGHEVARGVLVREIYADRVVIDLQGHQETLRIHWYDSGRPSEPARKTISNPAQPAPDTVVAEATEDDPNEPFLPPPPNDEGAVWKALALRPTLSGSQRVGARVFGTGAAARALGLDPGDIIVEVNGVPGGANFQYALSQVTEGDPIMLTVNRGGTSVPVTIGARELAAAANIYRAGP